MTVVGSCPEMDVVVVMIILGELCGAPNVPITRVLLIFCWKLC